MPTITLTLPKPHISQAEVIQSAARFNVLACGRRWGKTTLGIDRLVNGGMLDYPLGWFSPTYKMLLEVWREMRRVLQPVASRISSQERRIELITGGVVEMWSLDNPDAARGRKYKRMVVDEAALVSELLKVWHEALRPTLADYAGDAWFLSTPKGLNGFYSMHQWGKDDGDWRSWQMPSYHNPFVPPDEIESMRYELPERIFNQEVMAQFLDTAGGVFRRVQEAATARKLERSLDGNQYVMGVDWGKHADFTVITVLDMAQRKLVKIDRFNQIDYVLQAGRLRAICDNFRPITIIAERNSMGEPLIEQLQREGLPIQPFTTTNASKAQAIDALALAFERGEIEILDDPILLGELQAYEAERLPSGMLRYSAPDGMHDDTVMALALAWQGVVSYSPTGGIYT